ncbi:hypothetical protein MKK55_06565, partial [Methylobacterium sp. J-059]|uniref:hypothetical protein n=1 Tax=Methylobacterium sp. J-059 TaxID=2836643 RepID=UPI001FBB2E0A
PWIGDTDGVGSGQGHSGSGDNSEKPIECYNEPIAGHLVLSNIQIGPFDLQNNFEHALTGALFLLPI